MILAGRMTTDYTRLIAVAKGGLYNETGATVTLATGGVAKTLFKVGDSFNGQPFGIFASGSAVAEAAQTGLVLYLVKWKYNMHGDKKIVSCTKIDVGIDENSGTATTKKSFGVHTDGTVKAADAGENLAHGSAVSLNADDHVNFAGSASMTLADKEGAEFFFADSAVSAQNHFNNWVLTGDETGHMRGMAQTIGRVQQVRAHPVPNREEEPNNRSNDQQMRAWSEVRTDSDGALRCQVAAKGAGVVVVSRPRSVISVFSLGIFRCLSSVHTIEPGAASYHGAWQRARWARGLSLVWR